MTVWLIGMTIALPWVGAVGVLWGFGSRKELTAAGASALCQTPESLMDYLTPT